MVQYPIIEPLDYIESTNIDEHNQIVRKVNEQIGVTNQIDGRATVAEEAAVEAKNQAEASARSASDALDAATAAGEDAAKVNQFDDRIKGNMKDISYAPAADMVTAVVMKEDGTIVNRPIPTLDHDQAGMMTPAQMKDISDHLDTLGRDLNNVKAEYLDKYNLQDVQLVRSKTDWERSPLVPTLKSDEYTADNGKRAYNAASAAADPALMQRVGRYDVTAAIGHKKDIKRSIPEIDMMTPSARVVTGIIGAYDSGDNVITKEYAIRDGENMTIRKSFIIYIGGTNVTHNIEYRYRTDGFFGIYYQKSGESSVKIWGNDQ